MAKTNYSYPRVTMKTFAKKHSNNVVTVPDTTILFAPLVTEKGPSDRVIKVHSLAEFSEYFGDMVGSIDFYNLNGQMAINAVNWLSNGGTLLVKRIILDENEEAFFAKDTAVIDLKDLESGVSYGKVEIYKDENDNNWLANIESLSPNTFIRFLDSDKSSLEFVKLDNNELVDENGRSIISENVIGGGIFAYLHNVIDDILELKEFAELKSSSQIEKNAYGEIKIYPVEKRTYRTCMGRRPDIRSMFDVPKFSDYQ